MRTVIFFGLMCIAEAIGAESGWALTSALIPWGATIFVFAMVFDVVDVVRG